MPILAALIAAAVVACGSPTSPAPSSARPDPVDRQCQLPGRPSTVRQERASVVQVWQFPSSDVLHRPVIPDDDRYLAYRAAIRVDGADLRTPIADEPTPQSPEEAQVWRDERFNSERAHSGEVGVIAPITCLDALFFAHQNARVAQLDRPTEYLLSVLRKRVDGEEQLLAVFGASDEMFPPKQFYGFDTVDEYLARGWRLWYLLHNHTIQRRGDRLALGNPVLSTSDVQLVRNLAAVRGLESARVTNGFYTFSARADEFAKMRARSP